MANAACEPARLWQTSLDRLRREFRELSLGERNWIAAACAEIAALQQQLHDLFRMAKGEHMCRTCAGACCERGTHHATLANLLACLLQDESPPQPDFSVTCPFLGPHGCKWEVARRPFNCVTFICDEVEKGLNPAQQAEFYRLERNLRHSYEQFDRRYAGSSLRGFLIRAERLGARSFLERCSDR